MQLPADFILRTQPLLKDKWDSFVRALSNEAPTSIRLNTKKCISIDCSLDDRVGWCENGYYLSERPQFTFDPLFHAGCYYVQEASSMFIAQAVNQYVNRNVRFLDLCAAPGGKSTLITDLLTPGSLLVSNEVIRSRANILSENITKWGNPNTVVTNNDPQQIGKLNGFFDIILVDAPCSGEGMFRKDEGAVAEWSEANVKLCKERQQRIVADIWSALKPGGLLMYSTCTYNIEENEENVQWISRELGAKVLPVDTEEEWGIGASYVDGLPCYHFFPYSTKGEGFFFALLKKNDDERFNYNKTRTKKNKPERLKNDLPLSYKNYLSQPGNFTFYQLGDFWFAFPAHLFSDLQEMKSCVNIVSGGICIGESKGKDFIPNQSLALSNALNRSAFINHDIDWAEAIAYLRKEPLSLPDLPRGYILLTFRDIPLGFVKNIGNRANNNYPNEWRIRSANLPKNEVRVL